MSRPPTSRLPITGATVVAGVAGHPVRHSLSPLIHNAWLEAAGVDGVYVPFGLPMDGFERFVAGARGGTVRGINVTVPFKEVALTLADRASDRAKAAAAANILVFEPDGSVSADNSDGVGLISAFAEQAPGLDLAAGPVAILGAGGAARGAAAALLAAGAPEVRIINRTLAKAQAMASAFGRRATAHPLAEAAAAFAGVAAVVNATSAELSEQAVLDVPLEATPVSAVVMDMVYRPLVTPFLTHARRIGRPTVDGLAMLIGQAAPAFEAFYGRPPPSDPDIRALAIGVIEG